jgi:hypothetical protein
LDGLTRIHIEQELFANWVDAHIKQATIDLAVQPDQAVPVIEDRSSLNSEERVWHDATDAEMQTQRETARGAARGFYSNLADVLRRRTYREDYESFDDYCLTRWGLSRSQGYRWAEFDDTLKALEVAREPMSPRGDTSDRPPTIPFPSEKAARHMAGLPSERKVETWQEAQKIASSQGSEKAA